MRALLCRYEKPTLGFADAGRIACAEDRNRQLPTFDRHDFDVIAREGTISAHPSL